jgi:Trypsin-like peptidase domain
LSGSADANSVALSKSAAGIRAAVNCLKSHKPVLVATPSNPSTESPSSSGTGFFVAKGFVVTNAHVIKQCESTTRVKFPGDKSQKASMMAIDYPNDLALLYTCASTHHTEGRSQSCEQMPAMKPQHDSFSMGCVRRGRATTPRLCVHALDSFGYSAIKPAEKTKGK